MKTACDWPKDLYDIVGDTNSHYPEFFGIYSIEWLMVLPFSGMMNFFYSANSTSSELSDTVFF